MTSTPKSRAALATETPERSAGRTIPFSRPTLTGREAGYVDEVMRTGKFSGNGPFTKRCNEWLKSTFGPASANLTTSCTHALELSAMLADIGPGDEVILPSFAFTSTATAFLRAGATLVFVDIEPATMNVDTDAVAAAITAKTRAIVALHYAGVPCDMDAIRSAAAPRGVVVVEDAAQAMFSRYRGRFAGTLGHMGCFSFHETKNLHCGEGGAFLTSDARFVERAEIMLEKGTNRARFLRGQIDKYTWVDQGSSFLPSEMNAAFLLAQLEAGEAITSRRMAMWGRYHRQFEDLERAGKLTRPAIPAHIDHNGHIYFIKTADLSERGALIASLKERDIQATFHFVPLHNTTMGRRFGRFHGDERWTIRESERLLRLPLYDSMTEGEVDRVADAVRAYFSG